MTLWDVVRTAPSGHSPKRRTPRTRHYVMCEPKFFAVEYAINPWMDPAVHVDSAVVSAQWEGLRGTYRRLGHAVDVVQPVSGLPDMVFAANGGLIINGRAVVAQFKHPQRRPEASAYAQWMASNGYPAVPTRTSTRARATFYRWTQ